jgi:2-hydroxy-6-oxonona-2,4-dienedioate hydrolase
LAIQSPTLIVHARDDSLQLYHNAEFAAAKISGARLVSFAEGGHVVMLVEQAEIQLLVQTHLREHFGICLEGGI